METMKKVYVCGAYSDDNVVGVLRNIGRGEHYSSRLFLMGLAPFTPWHDKDFVIQNWNIKFTVPMFYEFSMAWLRSADLVFVVPNHEGLRNWQDSKGTLAEIEEAKRIGLPIYYSLNEIQEAINQLKIIV